MFKRTRNEPTASGGWGLRPITGIALAYLFSSLVAGGIVSLGVLASDYPNVTNATLAGSLGFIVAGLIFTSVQALIAFIPLRFALYQFRFSSIASFVIVGALEGGVGGFLFIQGFLLAWVFILAGAMAGATQWVLEKRFVGEIYMKPEKTPADE